MHYYVRENLRNKIGCSHIKGQKLPIGNFIVQILNKWTPYIALFIKKVYQIMYYFCYDYVQLTMYENGFYVIINSFKVPIFYNS